jgi:multiple antibiotic resistance protein
MLQMFHPGPQHIARLFRHRQTRKPIHPPFIPCLPTARKRGTLRAMEIALLPFLQMLAGLFAICDPVGTVPLFIAMTANQTPAEKRRTIARACITAAIVMVVSVVAGQMILDLFGIRIAAFRVVGGILLMIIAFSMLNANLGRTRHTPEEDSEAVAKEDVSIVPLAIPLIAGPGTISTVIMYAEHSAHWYDNLLVIAACLIVTLATYFTLRASGLIARALGQTGVNVITRIMGLILAAISIEFLAQGLSELFPGWAAG